jgi:hypothetical protein
LLLLLVFLLPLRLLHCWPWLLLRLLASCLGELPSLLLPLEHLVTAHLLLLLLLLLLVLCACCLLQVLLLVLQHVGVTLPAALHHYHGWLL